MRRRDVRLDIPLDQSSLEAPPRVIGACRARPRTAKAAGTLPPSRSVPLTHMTAASGSHVRSLFHRCGITTFYAPLRRLTLDLTSRPPAHVWSAVILVALIVGQCAAVLTLSSPRANMAAAVGGTITYFVGGDGYADLGPRPRSVPPLPRRAVRSLTAHSAPASHRLTQWTTSTGPSSRPRSGSSYLCQCHEDRRRRRMQRATLWWAADSTWCRIAAVCMLPSSRSCPRFYILYPVISHIQNNQAHSHGHT